MLNKTRIKLINLFESMIKKYNKKTFDRIIEECVNEAFYMFTIRKTVEITHRDEELIDVKITTYENKDTKTITQKEIFAFKDLAHLTVRTDEFIEDIRKRFNLGKE